MRRVVCVCLCVLLCLCMWTVTHAEPSESAIPPAFDQDSIALTFGVCGDLRIGGTEGVTLRTGTPADRFGRALQALYADGIDALLLTGDMLADGAHGGLAAQAQLWQWQQLLDETLPEDVALLYTEGECDLPAADMAQMLDAVRFADEDDRAAAAQGRRMRIIGGMYFIAVGGNYTAEQYYTADTLSWLEQALSAAAADPQAAGKPIFVITHAAVADTTQGSAWCASSQLTAVLEQYPQTVVFTGHTRSPLQTENSIMQTGFTAVDSGSFSTLCIPGSGFVLQNGTAEHGLYTPTGTDAAQGLYVEVDTTGAVRITRRDFVRNEAIGQPWVIPAPSVNGAHLSHYTADRADNGDMPAFPDGGAAIATQDDTGHLRLQFGAADRAVTYQCRVEHSDKSARYYKVLAPYWTATHTVTLSLPVSAAERPCTVTVTPVDEWGHHGNSIHGLWTLPDEADYAAAAAADAAILAVGEVTEDSGTALMAAVRAVRALTPAQRLLLAEWGRLREALERYEVLFAAIDEVVYLPDSTAVRDPGNWSSLSAVSTAEGVRVTLDRVVGSDVRTFGGQHYLLDGMHLTLRDVTGDGIGVALTGSPTASMYDAALRLAVTADGTVAFLSPDGGNTPVMYTTVQPLSSHVDMHLSRAEDGSWECTLNGQPLPVDGALVAELFGEQPRAYIQFFALPDADPALSSASFTVTALHGGDAHCYGNEVFSRRLVEALRHDAALLEKLAAGKPVEIPTTTPPPVSTTQTPSTAPPTSQPTARPTAPPTARPTPSASVSTTSAPSTTTATPDDTAVTPPDKDIHGGWLVAIGLLAGAAITAGVTLIVLRRRQNRT